MVLITGDLFEQEDAEVLVHGCNSFCVMGAGIAVQFRERYQANSLPMEEIKWKGNFNKLGTIDYGAFDLIGGHMGLDLKNKSIRTYADTVLSEDIPEHLFIVNAYTQFKPGPNAILSAIDLCMWKTCQKFKGKKIYVPMIGAGIGGLKEREVMSVFEKYPINVVKYDL